MRKIITFAVDRGTGLVYSHLGSEIAFPVLDYDKIGEDGIFNNPLEFHLEKCNVLEFSPSAWRALRWTKKIMSVHAKNSHRSFWGLPALTS